MAVENFYYKQHATIKDTEAAAPSLRLGVNINFYEATQSCAILLVLSQNN